MLDFEVLPSRSDPPAAADRSVGLPRGGVQSTLTALWRWFDRASVTAVIPPLLLVCVSVYLANGRVLGTGDTIPARYLPLSVLHDGNFDLDEFPELRATGLPYYLTYTHGHHVSVYPVTAALVALPFYLPLAFLDTGTATTYLPIAEKIGAAGIAALSVAFIWLALSAATSRRLALSLTIVYAFGTSTFSTTSQALWQHGPGQLGLCIMLWALVREARREHTNAAGWLLLAGLGAGLACAARPTNAILALSGLAALLARSRRAPLIAALGLAPAIVWHVGYNHWAFGDPLHLQWSIGDAGPWQGDMVTGLLGLLVSPSRGLFVYSPALLAAAPAVFATTRDSALTPLVRTLSAGVLLTILLYAHWGMWWGGTSYGPRIIADVAPPMTLLLVPSLERLIRGRWTSTCWTIAVVWSVGMHAIGAFCGNLSWNIRRDVDRHPERLWSWIDNQPVECGCVLVREAARRTAGHHTAEP